MSDHSNPLLDELADLIDDHGHGGRNGTATAEPKKRKAKPRIRPEAVQGPGKDREPQPGQFPLTDYGNAERMVHSYGHWFRYCHPWKKFLVWDKRRWNPDDTAAVERLAKKTARLIYSEADRAPSNELRSALAEHAIKTDEVRRIRAMMELAKSEPGIPILPRELDRDPWRFNVANGTIDLKTGRLIPHQREHFITQLSDVVYDEKATCPRFLEFLEDIFDADAALISYVQRLIGYTLSGVVHDHILPILWGSGCNGKSTLINVLMHVFGYDYAMRAPSELLLKKRGESHPTEKAMLFGKRLVVTSESDEGRHLAESTVKDLTGGDHVTARRMREDFWSFAPTHKILFVTNHRPIIRGTDYGTWRRVQLIPFNVTIPEAKRDPTLPQKLNAELPGVLAWAVRGCLEWQKVGLNPPESVTAATKAYRDSEDVLGEFIRDCCIENAQLRVRANVLYTAYKGWAERAGERVMTMKTFGNAITERGIEKPPPSNGIWYVGIGLQNTEGLE